MYDLKLDYYVAGLAFADSPYRHYSLGSAMVVHAEAYAIVRGYPKRSAGEDFYLLNKLAKYGNVAFDRSRKVKLGERISTRVPFGTGPGVARFAHLSKPLEAEEFYAPECFEALKIWLKLLKQSAESDAGNLGFTTNAALKQLDCSTGLSDIVTNATKQLDLHNWFENTIQKNSRPAQAQRQLNYGMDGLKTLQLIHALRDQGLGQVRAVAARDWLLGLNDD